MVLSLRGSFTSTSRHSQSAARATGKFPLLGWAVKRIATCATAEGVVQAQAIQEPLYKRAAVHIETVADLEAWRHRSLARVAEVGDSLTVDDGPSAHDLKRELAWLLEDTVTALRRGRGQSQHWEHSKWLALSLDIQAAHSRDLKPEEWSVLLRASISELEHLWRRRVEEREPFQYLVGAAHWGRYILSVGPGVLIPRPETELLPELAGKAIQARPALADYPWIDLGTGSGAIAIGLAQELLKFNQNARVLAVDISPTAAAYASANAAEAGLSPWISILQGSWFTPVHAYFSSIKGGVGSLRDLKQGERCNLGEGGRGEGEGGKQGHGLEDHHSSGSTRAAPGNLEEMSAPMPPLSCNNSTGNGAAEQPITVSSSALPSSGDIAPTIGAEPAAEGKRGVERMKGEEVPGCVGGILSNPPYIPSAVMAKGLQAEVGKHEPWTALDGGPGQGLESLQVICEGAGSLLVKDGLLALETHGNEQADLVATLVSDTGFFRSVRIVDDCFGVPRFVLAERK